MDVTPLYLCAHRYRDHYFCNLCGKEVFAHGNFGGGAIAHARMHERRGEAEDVRPFGGKRHLDERFIIIKK